MRSNANLKLVASQPAEAVLAHRLSEVQATWTTLLAFPYLPQSFVAWVSACDRLEAERLRAVRGSRK